MADNFDDLTKIRHVQPQDPLAAELTSQPTRALERRLQSLSGSSSAAASSVTQIIIPGVPIYTSSANPDQSVVVNDTVYYNAGTGLYQKAQATVTVIGGVFTANPTALGFGVVVAVNGAQADVMVGGFGAWKDASQQAAMLEAGEAFLPGVPLFLSASQPGKLTRFPPALRVQVLLVTAQHFVLLPSFSTPESIESLYRVPIGMRPVGALRAIGPQFTQNVIVGFDALELYDVGNSLWRLTKDGAVANHQNFGYLVADATVSAPPPAPIYIRLEVSATSGNLLIYSANSLAELYSTSGTKFNVVTAAALNGNAATLRSYSVLDSAGNNWGTLTFKFTDPDTTLARHVVFQFPDAFQGWKMTSAPVTPQAKAVVAAGVITQVQMLESSIGYQTPPTVSFTDGSGSGATAVAVLNEFGSVVSVIVTAGGAGYSSTPAVVFSEVISSLTVLNGGSGATGTATVSGGALTTLNLTAGGSGYVNAPDVLVVDAAGLGSGAVVTATVSNGAVSALNLVSGGAGYVTPLLWIRPAGNRAHARTNPGSFTPVMSGGTVASVTINNGGGNYPVGATARFVGGNPAVAATVTVTVVAGVITAVTPAGGSGYASPPTLVIDLKDPQLLFQGGSPITAATGAPVFGATGIDHVDVSCPGGDYDPGTTLTLSGGGGTGAVLLPVIVGGQILAVTVVNPGTGYTSAPTVNFVGAVNGANAILTPVLGTAITAATLSTPGSGYTSLPVAAITTPVKNITLQNGGSGYTLAPAVTLSAPEDPNGVPATAVAVLGGMVTAVQITNGGSGYTSPATMTAVASGGGGTGATFALCVQGGVVIDIIILTPGSGYSSAPTLTIGPGAGAGSGAAATLTVSSSDSVAAVSLTCQGTGYINPPVVTLAPSATGVMATALAKLLGGTAQVRAVMSGSGGLRMAQAGILTQGNNLQITTYHQDLDDGAVAFPAPLAAVFYYNIKADPGLAARYPAVPVDKASFTLNGSELLTSAYSEGLRLLSDLDADIGLARKTVFWPTFDVNGSPWDQTYQSYILDLGTGGRDPIIPSTGPVNYPDGWWRLWEKLFKYEPYRNRGWLSLNRASRFFQSGKVVSLAVLAPLRLVDLATGVDFSEDGTPQSGQLLLTLNNQVNVLGGSLAQIDLTQLNTLVAIYQNNTGSNVVISSVLLTVIYQNNQAGLTPTVANCAQITIGTQAGGYSNVIGSSPADVASTRLYAVNQVKELFPDADNAYVMLAPNDQLYLQVVNPAGAPIASQIVVARIKGHAF